jgi:hypothetical protein
VRRFEIYTLLKFSPYLYQTHDLMKSKKVKQLFWPINLINLGYFTVLIGFNLQQWKINKVFRTHYDKW